mgnify:CR=1 FL=1
MKMDAHAVSIHSYGTHLCGIKGCPKIAIFDLEDCFMCDYHFIESACLSYEEHGEISEYKLIRGAPEIDVITVLGKLDKFVKDYPTRSKINSLEDQISDLEE